jgi:DNA-binding NarL/FixJ family response regulator
MEQIGWSEMELKIIHLICQQYSQEEIAKEGNIRLADVNDYESKILKNIGAKSPVGIVIYAIKSGIFKP